jgi:dienelactone hydrolase
LTSAPAARAIRLEITPNPAFVDEDLEIRLAGLNPHESVVFHAKMEDDDKRSWASHAKFLADAAGNVDLRSADSLEGTYRGGSPMGLFWSMALDETQTSGSSTFAKKDASPNRVSLEVEVSDRVVAAAQLERNYLAPATETRDLTVEGDSGAGSRHTVGRLFIPPAAKYRRPCPVVIVLSGSGGGFDLDKAAVLSRHGFATLALAYFGVPPLPTWLNRIPLEYFEAAFSWLSSQPEVDSERIGILAVSKGAELALVLGSMFPQIRAVVAYAPSSVAWAASGRDKATGEIIPSWTHEREPIPFAPLPLRRFMFRSAIPVALLKKPVMFRNLFRSGLRNTKAIAAAAIPVERIRGPIMLVSGGDDHLWPAAQMSEAIVTRLKQKHFAHQVEHLHYPHAGHMLRYPYLPTTARDSRNAHLRGARFSFGGAASADAEAQSDSWRRAIEFLKTSLQ